MAKKHKSGNITAIFNSSKSEMERGMSSNFNYRALPIKKAKIVDTGSGSNQQFCSAELS